jgi:hypothetical protein
MATKFTSFTPLEEADSQPAPKFTSFTPLEGAEEEAGPTGLSALLPSAMRGFRGLASLGGDVIPAMAARAVGKDKYAEEQMQEAAAYGKETEKLYPAAVGSYTNVKDIGTGITYAVEAVGEAIPTLLPSLFTGGAAAIAGRGAVAAAKMAAEKAAMAQVAKGATAEAVKDAAMKAGVAAANKVALKYQATGALTGSAAQNIPDVFQNIYEKTGKMDLGAAIVAGGFNAALDAITPVQLLRKANLSGISPQEIAAAWYKRAGKGAAKGFVTEGGTEAIQEMSSAAAEKFVDNNLDFFTAKNFERFIDAGLKGGIGGGAITSATDVALGKGPEKKTPPPKGLTSFTPVTPAAPATPLAPKQQARQDAVAKRAQELEEQSGITYDDAIRIAEDDIAAEEEKIRGLTTKAPDTRVKTRAVELIDAGVNPDEAYATATQQIQDELEADAQNKEEGALDVAGTKAKRNRKSTGVVSQPVAGAPAAGVETTERAGVVPTGEDVGVPAVGEEQGAGALAETPVTAPTQFTTFTPTETQEGAPASVTTPIETKQTKPKKQKAAAATVAPEVPKVDIAAANAATDPVEIQQHLDAIEVEGATLLSADGRFPKKGTPKRIRLDEIGAVKRALVPKLQPPKTENEVVAPVVETTQPQGEVSTQLAKYEGLHGATRVGAIRGDIANNNKVLELADKRGETELVAQLTQENERLNALLPEAETRDSNDRAAHTDRQILGQAKSELDTAIANGEVSQETAEQLVDEARETGNVADAAEHILSGVDKTETPAIESKTEETKEPDSWYSFVDSAKEQAERELAGGAKGVESVSQYEGYTPGAFPQAKGPSQVLPVIQAAEAEEMRKRKALSAREDEAAAKAKEKAERATKEEQEQAESVGRPGAVDVVSRSLEIVGALNEIIRGKVFPVGVRNDAQKYLNEIIRASDEKEAPEGSLEPAFNFLVAQASKPRFMRTGVKKSLPSIGKDRVQSIVNLIASRWKNAPTVVVANSIDDSVVPEALRKANADAIANGAEGVPAGVFYDGKVYIFADQIKSSDDAVRVLLHESLGHYGLRGTFGAELDPILDLVAKNHKGEVAAIAKKYGLDLNDKKNAREAAEEVLANLAQTKPTMGVVQRAIAAVRRFLRRIGFDVKLSNADLIANYILPARAFVENERIARAVGGTPAFMRKATDNFLKWFGDSKVVDENGEPLVVYHGMPEEMEGGVFRESSYGSLGKGIYFTDDPDAAGRFATGVRGSNIEAKLQGNIVPAYLKLERPFDDNFFVGNKEWQGWVANYLRGGQDASYKHWASGVAGTRWHIGPRTESVAVITALHDKLMAGTATLNDVLFIGDNAVEAPWGKKLLEMVKDHGHFDGITLKNSAKGFNEYVVFNPNQVKSATGNNGEYSLTNNDIRFSRTEEENLPPEEKKLYTDTVRTQKEIDKAVAKAKFNFSESAKAQEAAKGVSTLQLATDPAKSIPTLRSIWKRATMLQRKYLAKLVPTSFLVNWAGDAIPELNNTNKLLQKMGGMTEQLLHSAGELTNEVERAFRADETLRGKLDNLTSVATLVGVDPATIDTAERNDELDKAWKGLGADGQKVYLRIRNHFEVLSKYLSKLLDDQVDSLNISDEDKKNLMKKIRATFEKGSRINPYFPLVREGDFWLAMGSGDNRVFFMAETATERDNAAREFAADKLKRGASESESAFEKRVDDKLAELTEDGEFESGDTIGDLRRKPYGQGQGKMLTGTFEAIDGINFADPEARERLKDAIYQTFLETMPDQSFRQQFIHRKGTAGFRVDVLRNTAHTSARMATQLARVKYSPLLRNSLMSAKASIRGRTALDPFVAEMGARVDSELAPKTKTTGTEVAGALNKMAFIYYLGGASSALLQPLSIFQTGMPVLAQYGTFKATREMGRMLKVWTQFGSYKTNLDGSKSWVAPSILYAKDTTDVERKAYKAAAEMGLFASTQAAAVFESKAMPTEKLRSPQMKLAVGAVDALVMGGLMNSSERLAREAMFLTSFRLNMEQHGNFDKAVTRATYDTNEALGNYGQSERPVFMKQSFGKVLTQFQMYPLHVASFLINNFKEMIKPMNGRTRGEAAHKFFGTMGSTFVLAGAAGLPMFSMVMGLMGAAWNQLKDDDWPEDMKSMDFEAWWTTVGLAEWLGPAEIGGVPLSDILVHGLANALTGLDIAGRTGLNNLFTRDSKEYKTVRESLMAKILEHAGPSANMVLSVADGVDAAMQGDYAKAVKKWSPAGFRNFVNAHELATEGAKDSKGTEILSKDAFTTGMLIGQSIGFRPETLANVQYATFKVLGAQQKVMNEHNLIIDKLDRAFRNENDKAFEATLDEIDKFNKKYPQNAILADEIMNSLEKRVEQRAISNRGVVPTEKNMFLDEVLQRSRAAADKAERENKRP